MAGNVVDLPPLGEWPVGGLVVSQQFLSTLAYHEYQPWPERRVTPDRSLDPATVVAQRLAEVEKRLVAVERALEDIRTLLLMAVPAIQAADPGLPAAPECDE